MTQLLDFDTYHEWECPACGLTEQTRPLPNRWHTCPKLEMMTVQLVRKGIKAKIELIERQDYVGNERVQLLGVNRRPIMAVVTTRDDGNDTVVYPPTAAART